MERQAGIYRDIGMFDYKKYLDLYRMEHGLGLSLSFNMPAGYETANGTFDAVSKTVFINAEHLKDRPDHEQAFYLFHELRHSLQYLCPSRFSSAVRRSLQYVIQYDGTCFRLVDGMYRECRLEGGKERFTDIYLGQPHEVDANTYAYEQVRKIYGDSEELRELYAFWTPGQPAEEALYDSLYDMIDEKTKLQP